jgi:hypothetical protein
MMAERDKPQPETVDEIKQEFRTHLLSVEFGSPDYLAFCDFFSLEQQKHLRRIEIQALKGKLSSDDNLERESQLRITEVRIAVLENDIERKKIMDIDYSKAHGRVEETMGNLRTAISNETKKVWPDEKDTNWVRSETEETYHDIFIDDFKDVLNRFYE